MNTIEILKKTYHILSSTQKKHVFWLVVCMIILAVAELVLAAMVSLLGVALAAPESLQALPIIGSYFGYIPSFGTVPQVVTMLVVVLICIAVAAIVKNIFTAFTLYNQTHTAQNISWAIASTIFKNYLYAPYTWYSQKNTAELQEILKWRVYIAAAGLNVLNIFTQGIILFFLVVSSFVASPWASLLLFGTCGTVSIFIYKFSRKKVSNFGQQVASIELAVSKVSHFALQGMREVQIYDQRVPFQEQYVSHQEAYAKAHAMRNVYPSLPLWILESAGFILLLVAVLLLQWQGKSVAGITGTLTLLAGISWRMLPAMNKFVGSTLQLKANIKPVEKIFSQYLNIPKGVATLEVLSFTKSLELKQVSYTYPAAEKQALSNINLSIKKGSMVGLIGLSGAGKSTLVGVLTGLLPINEGKYLLDGKVVQPSPSFLRLGYVPQNPYIMDATLAENVAFSDWGKEIDEEKVKACCRMAAMTFLDDLSEGIHTILGDRGVRLSGGQIQRVAIARALYTNPEILLFDEATSALDGAAETAIQKTILSLRDNMTIVIIAHRLSTVEGCDKVYWLDEGKVRSSGSSVEMLEEYSTFLQNSESLK